MKYLVCMFLVIDSLFEINKIYFLLVKILRWVGYESSGFL
nr:MAG TPA: hypothetical protein [Caudoviricetes sp.]